MKIHTNYGRNTPLEWLALATLMLALNGCGSDSNDDATPTANAPAGTSITKIAILSGAQESSPVATSATGEGSITVDSDTRMVSGEFRFTGVSATAAHIHTGAAGVSGPPAVTLTVDNATNSATVPTGTTLSAEQYDDLMAGNLYVNVHSAANAGGEIRGQLGRIVMTATVNGSQEVPPVTTVASGSGLLVVDPATRAVSGRVTFTGVAATGAHIHTGQVGESGGVVLPLTLNVDSAVIPDGSVLTEQQFDDLLAGMLYFNVHSASNPGGEIRGQIGPVIATAMLDGMQESPTPVNTSAKGNAVVLVDPVTLEAIGGVTFTGVAPTGAHIHTGAMGVSGGVAVALNLGTDNSSATVPPGTTMTQTQFEDLVAGDLYVNVHSAVNASGEIRGQLDRP